MGRWRCSGSESGYQRMGGIGTSGAADTSCHRNVRTFSLQSNTECLRPCHGWKPRCASFQGEQYTGTDRSCTAASRDSVHGNSAPAKTQLTSEASQGQRRGEGGFARVSSSRPRNQKRKSITPTSGVSTPQQAIMTI